MPTTKSIEEVLKMIALREFAPIELIAALKSAGINESAAKAAISFLINENQVEMTENRKLRSLELVA